MCFYFRVTFECSDINSAAGIEGFCFKVSIGAGEGVEEVVVVDEGEIEFGVAGMMLVRIGEILCFLYMGSICGGFLEES